MKNRIIIALDGISEKEALRVAKIMKGHVWGFKINDLLFEGLDIIGKFKRFGHVFADAKLYDIPNTVKNSVARLSKAGADMITVHSSGGIEMMKAAKQSAGRSKILAVTVLTSKSDSRMVAMLTKDAIKAKVDGIICSGLELKNIRRIPESQSLLKVVPGIRPEWYLKKDDQKRTMTPERALKFGADYLVIGRPVLNSKDSMQALKDIYLPSS